MVRRVTPRSDGLCKAMIRPESVAGVALGSVGANACRNRNSIRSISSKSKCGSGLSNDVDNSGCCTPAARKPTRCAIESNTFSNAFLFFRAS